MVRVNKTVDVLEAEVMNEKVKEFIEQKQKEKNEINRWEIEREKEKLLTSLGLVDKIYSPDGKKSDEYDRWESDGKGGYVYYKWANIEITDEEFDALKNCLNDTEEKDETTSTSEHSTIATILMVVAWVIYIGGFIAGFVLGVDRYGDFSPMAFVWWAVFFVAGTLYAGFAKVINLLCDIKQNTSK